MGQDQEHTLIPYIRWGINSVLWIRRSETARNLLPFLSFLFHFFNVHFSFNAFSTFFDYREKEGKAKASK